MGWLAGITDSKPAGPKALSATLSQTHPLACAAPEPPPHPNLGVPQDFHRFIYFDVQMTVLPILGIERLDTGGSVSEGAVAGLACALAAAETKVPHFVRD